MDVSKKVMSVILTSSMVLSLAACGSPSSSDTGSDKLTADIESPFQEDKPQVYDAPTETWSDVRLLSCKVLAAKLKDMNTVLLFRPNGELVTRLENTEAVYPFTEDIFSIGFPDDEQYEYNYINAKGELLENLTGHGLDIVPALSTAEYPLGYQVVSSKTDTGTVYVQKAYRLDTGEQVYEKVLDSSYAEAKLQGYKTGYIVDDTNDNVMNFKTLDGEPVEVYDEKDLGQALYYLPDSFFLDNPRYQSISGMPYYCAAPGMMCIGTFPIILDRGEPGAPYKNGMVKLVNYKTLEPLSDQLYSPDYVRVCNHESAPILTAQISNNVEIFNTEGKLLQHYDDTIYSFGNVYFGTVDAENMGQKVYIKTDTGKIYYKEPKVKSSTHVNGGVYELTNAEDEVKYLFRNGETRDDIAVILDHENYLLAQDLKHEGQYLTIDVTDGHTIGTFRVNMDIE